MEVNIESTACKQRWAARDASDIPINDRDKPDVIKKHVETIRSNKDEDNDNRNPINGPSVDLRNIRATEMKHNSKMTLPDPASNREEIYIQNQKLLTLNEFNKYVDKDCNDDNVPFGGQNLTKSELRGLKEIRNHVRSGEWRLYQTDKSGRLVLDITDNFIKCMMNHIKNDQDATL